VVIGKRRKMDAFLTTMPSLRQYVWGLLSCEYGIVADVDFGSEKVRFLGALRSSVWSVYRILCAASYKCRITFLPCDRDRQLWHGVRCTRNCPVCFGPQVNSSDLIDNDHQDQAPDLIDNDPQPQPQQQQQEEGEGAASSAVMVPAAVPAPAGPPPAMPPAAAPGTFTAALTFDTEWADDMPVRYEYLIPHARHRIGNPLPAGWQSREAEMGFASFQNTPWLMPGMLVAPYAHLSDGCMDVCYASSSITRWQFLKLFTQLAEAAHVHNPKLEYLKVRSLTLEPLDNGGFLGVDGERIPFAPLQIHVIQNLVTVLCFL
jgi:hypothetical protein